MVMKKEYYYQSRRIRIYMYVEEPGFNVFIGTNRGFLVVDFVDVSNKEEVKSAYNDSKFIPTKCARRWYRKAFNEMISKLLEENDKRRS